MTTYAIGNLHNGYESLQRLLETIQFNKEQDVLWFSGNLANHGKDTLAILRFVKELGQSAVTVLGDNDIKLLSIAEGFAEAGPDENYDEILNAPDRDTLLRWLRQCPFIHHDPKLNFIMVHAGIPAEWSLSLASTFSIEAETALAFGNHKAFLENMRGNPPRRWNAKLQGWKRLQFIVNAFTRIRCCNDKGYMDFSVKVPVNNPAQAYIPWYQLPNRDTSNLNIVFSHWAENDAVDNELYPNIYPLNAGAETVSPGIALKLSSGIQRISSH